MSELVFDHVGSFHCEGKLILCDVEWLDPRLAGMQRGNLRLDLELDVVPGGWQALVAREAGKDAIHFVVLSHDDELDEPTPLDQAESIGLLRIDSGRIAALVPELRADERVRTTALATEREDLPAMIRMPEREHDEPGGALFDVDTAGVFAVYAPPGVPRTALFLALAV
ncbi:hypothetical protein ACNOYE_07245 [Nannocystaceae bacterium ST9]